MGTPLIGVPGLVLSDTIAPTRPSLTYRAGLLIVALAMLLLPVIYLALVAGAAALVWWHLTANAWMLTHANQWRLIGYLAPAIVGVVLVFFMIKPVLARSARHIELLPLSRAQQPELFAFIEAICRQVRAPVPQRVQVDCQVNASAGFPPGYLSLFGRDLVLTIGLPLVAGLSVRELGGVLAHEFGHFAQGGGMRLTMVVRTINAWFARVVYERDQWDATLEAWSKGGDWRVMFVLLLARGSVGLSRWALWALMWAGHAISCFMLRQMEYDADSYEVKFAGSQTFARTSARLRHLNAGAQLGYGDLRHWWQKRMLPANFPLFLTERSIRMPRDMVEQLGRVADAPTGLFDTHPSDADRIRVAEAAAAQGILVGGDVPATMLVRDFESLGAAVTRHHYEHDLGLDVNGATLLATPDAVADSQQREDAYAAVLRFFAGRVSARRPLRVPIDAVEQMKDEQLGAALVAARTSMESSGSDLADVYRRFERLAEKREKGYRAEQLMLAGFKVPGGEAFELADPTIEKAAAAQTWAADQQHALTPRLMDFEEVAQRRLACAACLAGRRSSSLPIRSLVAALDVVAAVVPVAHEVRCVATPLAIAQSAQPDQPGHDYGARIDFLHSQVTMLTRRMSAQLGDAPCPEGFVAEPISMAAWCDVDNHENVFDAVDRVLTLYTWLIEKLVMTAEEAEQTSL